MLSIGLFLSTFPELPSPALCGQSLAYPGGQLWDIQLDRITGCSDDSRSSAAEQFQGCHFRERGPPFHGGWGGQFMVPGYSACGVHGFGEKSVQVSSSNGGVNAGGVRAACGIEASFLSPSAGPPLSCCELCLRSWSGGDGLMENESHVDENDMAAPSRLLDTCGPHPAAVSAGKAAAPGFKCHGHLTRLPNSLVGVFSPLLVPRNMIVLVAIVCEAYKFW